MVGTPSDVVMVRMQADGKLPVEQRRGYKNVFDGLIRITREEGILSMFRVLIIPDKVRKYLSISIGVHTKYCQRASDDGWTGN